MSLLRPMPSIREDLNRLFYEVDKELFGSVPLRKVQARWTPPADIWEEENDMVVRLAIPGYQPQDIEVAFEDKTLTVTAHPQEAEAGDKKRNHFQKEIFDERFYYAVRIPLDVEGDKATARFEHGILTITIPKAVQCKRHKIQIN